MKKQSEAKPHIFGVRHFSPAGAYYVREYLDKVKPKIILAAHLSLLDSLIFSIILLSVFCSAPDRDFFASPI